MSVVLRWCEELNPFPNEVTLERRLLGFVAGLGGFACFAGDRGGKASQVLVV